MTSNARKTTGHFSSDMLGKKASEDMLASPAEAEAQDAKAEKQRRWRMDYADAIRAENDYIDKHGLPLSKYRLF